MDIKLSAITLTGRNIASRLASLCQVKWLFNFIHDQFDVTFHLHFIEDIPADLCTHIIFAFGWLKKGKLSSFESNDETKDSTPGLFERVNNLKKSNPKLKVRFNISKLPGKNI